MVGFGYQRHALGMAPSARLVHRTATMCTAAPMKTSAPTTSLGSLAAGCAPCPGAQNVATTSHRHVPSRCRAWARSGISSEDAQVGAQNYSVHPYIRRYSHRGLHNGPFAQPAAGHRPSPTHHAGAATARCRTRSTAQYTCAAPSTLYSPVATVSSGRLVALPCCSPDTARPAGVAKCCVHQDAGQGLARSHPDKRSQGLQ